MKAMNRVGVLVLLLLAPLGAPLAHAEGPVFVDTDPMGARISLDGRLLSDRTPALLRGLTGRHRISLWLEGFQQHDLTVDAADGKVETVSVPLVAESAVLAFPANAQVSDAAGVHPTAGNQFRYPAGRYDLDNNGTVSLKPVFPDEGLLTVAGWAAVLLSSAAVVSIASDTYRMRAGWTDHPSELSLGLTLSEFFELPWYGTLLARKRTFDRTTAPQITPAAEHLDQANDVFDDGETALQAGDLGKAERFFTRLVKQFPESRLVPGAWFRLARIHSATGRRELALGEYRLVAETYPQADTYDRARKALADLYEAAGEKALAVENLDKMVLSDGFFDPADVAAQKTRLEAVPEAPHAP